MAKRTKKFSDLSEGSRQIKLDAVLSDIAQLSDAWLEKDFDTAAKVLEGVYVQLAHMADVKEDMDKFWDFITALKNG